MVERATVRGADAERLEVQILLHLKVRSGGRWVATQLRLEQREGELDGVQVRRVRGKVLEPDPSLKTVKGGLVDAKNGTYLDSMMSRIPSTL